MFAIVCNMLLLEIGTELVPHGTVDMVTVCAGLVPYVGSLSELAGTMWCYKVQWLPLPGSLSGLPLLRASH